MNVHEYGRVFGYDPYAIKADEVIVDIGSGNSDLSGLTPDGLTVQVDPIYQVPTVDELVREGQAVEFPISIGGKDPNTRKALSYLGGLNPTRVTIANALRYVSVEDKVRAIEQMLALGRGGLTQIYPYRSSKTDAVSEAASRLGFNVTAQKVGLGGLRQITYGLARINSTLTVERAPKRAGPADRKKLATLIVNNVI